MGLDYVRKWFVEKGQYYNELHRVQFEFRQHIKKQIIMAALSKMNVTTEMVKAENERYKCQLIDCFDECKSKYERLSNVELLTFDELQNMGPPDSDDDDSCFECAM